MTGEAPPLVPGGIVGIVGGGQLGRMLALAAAQLGLHCHIYTSEENSPASAVASQTICAPYDDEQALGQFAAKVDVITYEFENIPLETIDFLSQRKPVRPSAHALDVAQDRLTEKTFIREIGIPVADFSTVNDLHSLQEAVAGLGTPCVLKTRHFGYDGKGQVLIQDSAQCKEAYTALEGAPAIAEAFVSFEREVSVLVSRFIDGAVVFYDPVENEHKNHILHRSYAPARLTTAERGAALSCGARLVEALDYVGLLAVELFVLPEGDSQEPHLLVNEIAPRVHNSGHWTQDACATSQFEQHIRAVCGWPSGDVMRHCDAVMTNLIGDDVERWHMMASEPACALLFTVRMIFARAVKWAT
ncbi:MAG: 5-(carboxyamino)imidazole ribonucleotide synthase [Parvularculales bacterium]